MKNREPLGDSLPAIAGAVFASALTVYLAVSVGRFVYVMIGLLVVAVCVYWLLAGRKLTVGGVVSGLGNRVHLLLNLLFITLYFVSLVLLATRPEPYSRPIGFFAVISIMAAIVSLEIVFTATDRHRSRIVLSKIILIGVTLVFTQTLLFPSVIGIDPWWHQMFTSKITESGYIPDGYFYSQLPIFHVEVSSVSSLLDMDYKMSVLLSISLFQIIVDVLFIFLLGRILFSERIGALASLLLVTSSYYLNMGFWTIPNTIAAALVPCILYFLVRASRARSFYSKDMALAFIFMLVLVLTHTVAAGGTAICLFVGWFVYVVYSKHSKGRIRCLNTYTPAVPFSIGMIGWWTYASGHFGILVFLFQSGFSKEPFDMAPDNVVRFSSMVVEFEQVFNWLGISLFLSLSLIGFFYVISGRHRDPHACSIVVMGIAAAAIPFFSMITGHRVYEHRFWYLALMILCIPLAVSLVIAASMFVKSHSKSLFVSVSVFLMVFLMITCPTANIDNSQLSPNTSVRFALLESELQTGVIVAAFNKTIDTDFYYSIALYWSGTRAQSADDQLLHRNFTKSGDNLILIRNEVVHRPFWLYGTLWKLDYNPVDFLDSQNYSRCYDCGTVVGFSRGY